MVQADFSSRPASEDFKACLRISSCITLIVTSGDFVRTFSCQNTVIKLFTANQQIQIPGTAVTNN